MSEESNIRFSPLTQASQLDVEEAATTTLQNVEARSKQRQRHSWADVARQGAGLRSSGSVRRSTSSGGLPSSPQRDLQYPHATAGAVPYNIRHARRLSQAQELLKATTGVHGPGSVHKGSLTRIDFNDVFSQDVFHNEKGGGLSQSIDEGDEDEGSESDQENIQAADETDPLHSNVPTYGSGRSGGSSQIPSRRQTRKRRGKKISLPGALCWPFRNSCILRFALPLAAAAWILINVFEIPTIGAFDISWCFFAARQLAVVDVARILQYLLVDCLFIKSTQYFQLFGPLLTVIAIQSKGWPLVLFFWGLIDMALFQSGTPIAKVLKSHLKHSVDAAVDKDVVNSEVYLQIMRCLVIAGAMTAVKRVYVSITFGRRQYQTFAARLDSILADVVLLNEIATLATHADSFRHEEIDSQTVQKKANGDRGLFQVSWACIRKDSVKTTPVVLGDQEADINEDTDAVAAASEHESQISFSTLTSNRKNGMKDILHDWEEPETIEEENNVSIHDVLLFRRALSFMDLQFPFGFDFGPASTRDECVQSSTKIFDELCKLSSNANASRFEFSILALLAESENGQTDEIKKATLYQLFRPHTDGCLTKLMFVQSCDNLFRRLTYFRASLQNSRSLDRVLERGINVLFYFVLAMFLLSVLRFDPWSLLLSITSLLVSCSFAFGQTISKYIHGVIMIAVYRPFDLGDRVFLAPSGSIETGFGNDADSWFVEEIHLGFTKLRYAKTGETAYIQNSALNEMRIHNLNRTSGALVLFELNFHISIFDNNNLPRFKEALKSYVKDHPRRWECLDYIICDKILTDMEQTVFSLAFRHRNNWQDAPIIALHRSDLLKFIMDASKELGIAESSPVLRQIIFMGSKVNDAKVRSSSPGYANVESADEMVVPSLSSGPAIDNSQDISQVF